MLQIPQHPAEASAAPPAPSAALVSAAITSARPWVIQPVPSVPAVPPVRARGGLPPRALRRVREYIAAHLDKTISVRTLAGIAGLSLFHFARTFKQSEGVTPHTYLLRCRVQRAQQLLSASDLSLSEIALAAGFSDQSHFTRRFREHIGLTPSTYRWMNR